MILFTTMEVQGGYQTVYSVAPLNWQDFLSAASIPFAIYTVRKNVKWVDDKFEANEDFVGLHSIDDITAATIVHVVTDTVCHLTLSMSICKAH